MKCFKLYLFSSLVLPLVLFQCTSDYVQTDNDLEATPPLETVSADLSGIDKLLEDKGSDVMVQIAGQVVNEKDEPIQNAKVSFGTQTTTTDENGFFFVESTTNPYHAYVRVESAGYFTGSTSFQVIEEELQRVTIMLMENSQSKKINSVSGGELEIDEYVQLEFPSDGFVKEDGSTYTGEVTVSSRYLNPKNENIGDQMPGRLEVFTKEGELAQMLSYGMATIELTGSSGEQLQVHSEKEVKVVLPAPVDGPLTVSLSYFNEEIGFWVEEEQAQKVGDQYVGYVSHFTVWGVFFNNQDGWDVSLELRGEDDRELPYEGIPVNLSSQNSNWFAGTYFTYSHGRVDYTGLPSDEVLTATFYIPSTGEHVVMNNINKAEHAGQTLILRTKTRNLLLTNDTIVDCNGDPVASTPYVVSYATPVKNNLVTGVTDEAGRIRISIPYDHTEEYLAMLSIEGVTVPFEIRSSSIVLELSTVCASSGTPETSEAPEFQNTFMQPNNNQLYVNQLPVLAWSVQDRDGDDMRYTILFGTSENSLDTLVKDLSYQQYQMENPLQERVTYYWKVIATDVTGLSSVSNDGNAWSFTTHKFYPYEGDLTITSQTQLDEYPGYSYIKGDLTITGSDITDLTALLSIDSVKGNLYIYQNNQLLSLRGLDSLTIVRGWVTVDENPELITLDGLQNIEYATMAGAVRNPNLVEFCAYKKLFQDQGRIFTILYNGDSKNGEQKSTAEYRELCQ